jgi:hypothetical protein
LTIAKVYGLTENPFEPTGAAIGKYPFVAPANFHVLEEKIRDAGIEKKFYALLVNSPHGAGKSTTMEFLKKKATTGGYLSYQAPVILTRLSTLSIADFVQDVLAEVGKCTGVKTVGKPKRELSKTGYREELISALSPLAAKSKLMLWIVDEFDILADRPEDEQKDFLQFLRGVVDGFASKDIPIAFIMSHTRYSSREFERHLSEEHGPFSSRIVASIPLAYTFEEVKQIVFLRLKKASSTPRKEGDMSPFSEDALRTLYDLVLQVRGTDKLDNFRTLERICHFALIEGAKRSLREIDTRLIQELFKEYGNKEATVRGGRHLSMKTTQEVNTVKSKSLMERNETILRGIVTGISKSTFLGREAEIRNYQTAYIGPVGVSNIVLSSLTFGLEYQKRLLNTVWFVATNKLEIIQEKDLEEIVKMISSKSKEYESYSHIQILSFVSSVDVPRIPTNSFKRVIRFSDGMAEDLIGLVVGDEKDFQSLIRSFDVEIALTLSQLVEKETRDITALPSQSSYEVIQTLFVMDAAGQSCTRATIQQDTKKLFMRTNAPSEKFVSEAIRLGFGEERAGQIEPSVPRAYKFLLENLLGRSPQEEQELLSRLGMAGQAILESAMSFHMVRREDSRISKREISDYDNEMKTQISKLRQANLDEMIRQSAIGALIQWLLGSYDTSKQRDFPYSRYIILSAIEKLEPDIEREINKLAVKAPSVTKAEAPSQAARTEEKAQEAAPPQGPQVEGTKEIDNVIVQAVRNQGSMSIQEIDTLMKQKGYEEDIKRTVFRLILEGKLKIIVAG